MIIIKPGERQTRIKSNSITLSIGKRNPMQKLKIKALNRGFFILKINRQDKGGDALLTDARQSQSLERVERGDVIYNLMNKR